MIMAWVPSLPRLVRCDDIGMMPRTPAVVYTRADTDHNIVDPANAATNSSCAVCAGRKTTRLLILYLLCWLDVQLDTSIYTNIILEHTAMSSILGISVLGTDVVLGAEFPFRFLFERDNLDLPKWCLIRSLSLIQYVH